MYRILLILLFSSALIFSIDNNTDSDGDGYSDIEELIKTLQTDFDEKEDSVKQLASKFTTGAESLQSLDEELPIDDTESTDKHSTPQKRKRNISGELTLDD